MKKESEALKLTTAAVMLALAFALSYVTIFKLPWGGAITLFSMLPICIVSFRHGIGWGLGTAFCYSWLQILQGGVFGWGLTPAMLVASLLLDYILAFTVIGLAGALRRFGRPGLLAGVAGVCLLRFFLHFIAGGVLWANFEQFIAFGKEWVNHPWLYSMVYNGSFMLPEMLLTVAGAAVLLYTPVSAYIIKKQ